MPGDDYGWSIIARDVRRAGPCPYAYFLRAVRL